MNWKNFWQRQGEEESELLQVGRQGGLSSQQTDFFERYAAYVAKQLNLTTEDILLDVCCGNGMLTHHLAKHCKAVVGVDFSENLIHYANAHFATDSITFVCLDANKLQSTTFVHGFTKASLCFSFQYFETVAIGKAVVEGIFDKGVKQLFLGDVPDREKFFWYYNSVLKIVKLIKQMLQNRNDMGKFWSEEELNFMANALQVSGKKIIQPATFPYAHYRMDYLMTKD